MLLLLFNIHIWLLNNRGYVFIVHFYSFLKGQMTEVLDPKDLKDLKDQKGPKVLMVLKSKNNDYQG
jgi:hypothetical protein